MSVVGQAVLSAFLQVLFDRLASPELLNFARNKQVYSEFKKWERTLLKIYAVLDDAEEKQLTNKFVKIWLTELRDLAYDVEDILEEFATEASHQQQIATSQTKNGKLTKLVHVCSDLFPGKCLFNIRMESKMKVVTARLQEISSKKVDLDLKENSGGFRRRMLTTSLVNEEKVLGRGIDKDAVFELLVRDYGCDDRCCVVAIIGMGGLGKTTLAQLVYNDDRLNDCFELKGWICVSDDFDVLRVTKTILESVTHCNASGSNLNLLQERLQDVLTDKKFLFVLDDIWNEDYHNWDLLCSPFRNAASGSKIIVTTRNEDVASAMGSVATYHLKELSYDDCLPLFTQLALGTGNFDAYPNLKEIGEGIVKRCKGLPLAAKTLGSLLRTKLRQEEWEDVLHSKIWDLPEERNGILPALRLSYHHLPAPLKQCFAYCSIFPKGFEFRKEDLVLLWLAEGYLQQPKGTKRMEKLGNKYFEDLLSRSLFQRSNSNESLFVMHDLINDLAQYVAGEVCFRLEDRQENLQDKIPEKVRHMSYVCNRYEIDKKFEVLRKTDGLRSLLPLSVRVGISLGNFYLARKVLYDLLPKLRCLRVLSLDGYCFSSVPDMFHKLRHLRYLNLSRTSIKMLPESVCALCNLQTLLLHSCGSLQKLPAEIAKLTNLRHLDITNTRQLQEMPLHMEKLINLRTLSKFIVRRTSGSRITELRDLLHLQGSLVIAGLHNVESVFDAEDAILQCKLDLRELVMEWSDNSSFQNGRDDNDNIDIDVLQALQPNKNLERLKVAFYSGITFPSWIGDPSFSKFTSLTLTSCMRCALLPALGNLPSLEDLCIQGMPAVKVIGPEFYGGGVSSTSFPSLKYFSISDMLELEDWSSTIAGAAVEREFPCLCELHIRNCPKLVKRLPNHLPSLVKLDICKCPLLVAEIPRVPHLCELNFEECNDALVESMIQVASLTKLQLQNIPNGDSNLLHGRFLQHLVELKVMNIINCNGLGKIGDQMLPFRLERMELHNCRNLKELPDGFCNFMSLNDLKIKRCPKLVSFPETGLPWKLRFLVIEECEALECLPNALTMRHNNGSGSISSSDMRPYLESLEIIKCPSLKSFPEGELPSSLKVLKIWDCADLESLPEVMLQSTPSLECLSVRKYANLQALPERLHCFTHLIELHISYCAGLQSFPESGLPNQNLRRFYVFNCPNIRSLPDNLHKLTSLHHLGLSTCPRLESFPEGGLPPNLISLRINNCENLPLISEWGLRRLASLKDFTISGGCPNLVSFANERWFPASLNYLRLGNLVNLESLSSELQNLKSLEVLEITECPKLRSLPKKGLPATLSVIEILDCPILKRKFLKRKGKYWSVIANVPRVQIDEELLQ